MGDIGSIIGTPASITTGLSLTALALMLAYFLGKNWTDKRQDRANNAIDNDDLDALKAVLGGRSVPIDDLSKQDRRDLAFAELRQRGRFEILKYFTIIIIALLVVGLIGYTIATSDSARQAGGIGDAGETQGAGPTNGSNEASDTQPPMPEDDKEPAAEESEPPSQDTNANEADTSNSTAQSEAEIAAAKLEAALANATDAKAAYQAAMDTVAKLKGEYEDYRFNSVSCPEVLQKNRADLTGRMLRAYSTCEFKLKQIDEASREEALAEKNYDQAVAIYRRLDAIARQ